jgi:hypothetical protein
VLVPELRLGVLEHLFVLTGAAEGVQRALRRRHGLGGRGGHRGGGVADRAGCRHGLGLAAELLDAPLDLARVRLGLAEVLLQALLVRRLGGHPDVRLKRRLELPLLSVRLVEVLDQL